MQKNYEHFSSTIWLLFLGIMLILFTSSVLFSEYAVATYTSFNLFVLLFLVAFVTKYLDTVISMGVRLFFFPILITFGYKVGDIVLVILITGFLSGALTIFFHQKVGNINIKENDLYKRSVLYIGIPLSFSLVLMTGLIADKIILSKYIPFLIIGVLLFILGTYVLFTNFFYSFQRQSVQTKTLLALGVGAGLVNLFTSGILALTAGQVALGIREKDAIAVSALNQSIACVFATLASVWLGGTLYMETFIPIFLGSMLAIYPGVVTVRMLPANIIRKSIGYSALVFGALSIFIYLPYL